MAGHARYTALLDACVLFPVAVCDSLMSVGTIGLFAPKWTTRIEDEWTRSLEQKYGKPPGTYDKRRDAMRDPVLAAFREQRLRLQRGDFTPEVFAAALERNGLVVTAQRLRDAAALI